MGAAGACLCPLFPSLTSLPAHLCVAGERVTSEAKFWSGLRKLLTQIAVPSTGSIEQHSGIYEAIMTRWSDLEQRPEFEGIHLSRPGKFPCRRDFLCSLRLRLVARDLVSLK